MNEHFRLIALDLPGHGKSDKSLNPKETYTISGYGDILVEFCNQLELENVTFIGFSLGGHIIVESLDRLNASGVLISGAPPISKMEDFGDALLVQADAFSTIFNATLSNEEMEFIASAQFSDDFNKDKIPDSIKNDLQNTDSTARTNMIESLSRGEHKDEKEIVKNLKIPIAIINGSNELLVKLSYLNSVDAPTLWNNKVSVIANAGHATQLENPLEFNKILSDFASSL